MSAPPHRAFSRRPTCRRSSRPDRAARPDATVSPTRRHIRGATRMSDNNGSSGSAYKYVTYETLDDGRVARIMLNRPDARNAQHRGLLVELNECFMRAEADDTVRVVILGGN